MATVLDIVRYRGDTVPDILTIKDSTGAVVDITGFGFKLSVDSTENPTDETTQLYKLVGVIPTGTDGKVEFSPTPAEANQLGEFFYDVEMTDAGAKIQTILVGGYEYLQDYTKT